MARLAEARSIITRELLERGERGLPGIDRSSLERLVPDELLKDEATGLQTFKLYGSRLIKDPIPAATVTGVDACAAAIEYAVARYSKPGLNFRVGDAMDFDDGPFAAVISLETIEHLPNPQAFMGKSYEKAASAGRAFRRLGAGHTLDGRQPASSS